MPTFGMHDDHVFQIDQATKDRVRAGLRDLTNEERRILGALMAGSSRAEICVRTGMLPNALGQVCGRIRRVLGIRSIVEAAAYVAEVQSDQRSARAEGILTHF